MKTCVNCNRRYNLSNFYFTDKNKKYTSCYCKKCDSERRSTYGKIKRQMKSPEAYNECDKCGFVWSINKGQFCSKCGEESLNEYIKTSANIYAFAHSK